MTKNEFNDFSVFFRIFTKLEQFQKQRRKKTFPLLPRQPYW